MFHVPNTTLEIVVYSAVAVLLLYLGWRGGKWAGLAGAQALMAQKEQELFTAQRGFKNLYETELNRANAEAARLKTENEALTKRVEEYRKKAAGFGGLFGTGAKRAEAMYALLLENEALEEALLNQNRKLGQERKEAIDEQMRATGYRRVLISQLMKDERIKGYVREVMDDDKRLPDPRNGSPAGGPRREALPGVGPDAHPDVHHDAHEDAR